MFKYENQGRLIYLVYGIKEDDEIDSVILGMLTNIKFQAWHQLLIQKFNKINSLNISFPKKYLQNKFLMIL